MADHHTYEAGDTMSPAFYKENPLDYLNYPVCIITSGAVLQYANSSFIEFFKVNKSDSKLNWPAYFGNDHRKFVARAFIRAMKGVFSNCHVEIKIMDAGTIPVELLMQPVVNGVQSSSVMVLIKFQDKNRSISSRYNSSVEECDNTGYYEFSPHPVLRFNRELKVVRCSRSFEGLIGYNVDDLSACSAGISAVFKYDSEKIRNHMHEIMEWNIPFKRLCEIKIRSRAGDEKTVNLVLYPIINDNEITAVDMIIEDITKIKELRERLAASKRLNFINEIGRVLMQSINSTAASILEHARTIQTSGDVSDGLALIEKQSIDILEQLDKTRKLVDDKNGAMEEREESFESILNDALEFVKIYFRISQSGKKRNILIEKTLEYDAYVRTDTNFLRELIIWLILDVSAYAGNNGRIDIGLAKTQFVCLTVSADRDSNAGENIVPFTIDGFTRYDIRSAAEKLILKVIEEESSGKYSLKIIIPPRIIIEKKRFPYSGSEFTIARKNIMIIENDKTLQMIIGNLFERMGNRIFIADDGARALEEFKSKKYDIIISDYELEGINGLELAVRMKELNEGVLTVLISSRSIDPRTCSGSVDLFILKPFDIDYLINRIAEHLKPE